MSFENTTPQANPSAEFTFGDIVDAAAAHYEDLEVRREVADVVLGVIAAANRERKQPDAPTQFVPRDAITMPTEFIRPLDVEEQVIAEPVHPAQAPTKLFSKRGTFMGVGDSGLSGKTDPETVQMPKPEPVADAKVEVSEEEAPAASLPKRQPKATGHGQSRTFGSEIGVAEARKPAETIKKVGSPLPLPVAPARENGQNIIGWRVTAARRHLASILTNSAVGLDSTTPDHLK